MKDSFPLFVVVSMLVIMLLMGCNAMLDNLDTSTPEQVVNNPIASTPKVNSNGTNIIINKSWQMSEESECGGSHRLACYDCKIGLDCYDVIHTRWCGWIEGEPENISTCWTEERSIIVYYANGTVTNQ